MTVCEFFAASIVSFARSGLPAEQGPLAGLPLALLVAFSSLVLYGIVGRILALFLAATRREVPLFDCTTHDVDALDFRMMLDGLLPNDSQVDDLACPQTRIFEWIECPPGDEFVE